MLFGRLAGIANLVMFAKSSASLGRIVSLFKEMELSANLVGK